MGSKFSVEPNQLTWDMIRATTCDLRRSFDKNPLYIKNGEDLKLFAKKLREEKIPEKSFHRKSRRVSLLCRLLSYEMRKKIVYIGNEKDDETKEIDPKATKGDLVRSPNRRNGKEAKVGNKSAPKSNTSWDLPVGVLGLIFSYCRYGDYISIASVNKKWRKSVFQLLKGRYEMSVGYFIHENRKFSKNYSLGELLVTEKKNHSAYMVRGLDDELYKVDIITIDSNKRRFYKLLKRIHFSTLFDHPFFPKVRDLFHSYNTIKVITEASPSVDLIDLSRSARLDEKEIAYIIKCVLLGVQHAHSKDVLLRSISLNTVHLDIHGNVLLMDLKGAILSNKTIEDEEQHSLQGTCEFASPEMVAGRYGFKSDVYSVGLISLFLLSHKYSFGKHRLGTLYKTGCSVKYKLPDVSEHASAFLNLALDFNPKTRPSVTELLAHPFIASVVEKEPKNQIHLLVSHHINSINFDKAIQNL